MIARHRLLCLPLLIVGRSTTAQVARLDAKHRLPLTGAAAELRRPVAATVGSAGDLFVVGLSGDRIFVFSPDGKLKSSFGRKGGGPGEMRSPVFLGSIRDSVWLFDASLARITVFDSAQRVGRTIPLPVTGIGTLHRDGVVTIHSERSFDLLDHEREMLRIQRLARNGRVALDTFVAPLGRRTLRYDAPGGVVVGKQPFDDHPHLAPAPSVGGFYYVFAPDRSRRFVRVARYDSRWRMVWSIQLPLQPIRLTEAIVQRAVEAILAERGSPASPAEAHELRAALFVPNFLPAVTHALATSQGTLWLRREDERADSVRWTMIDSMGRRVGDLRLGASDAVLASRGPRVWWRSTTSEGDEEIWSATIRVEKR